MKWFKHLTASGNDPDIGDLMDELGFKGYYMFFRTLEIMSEEFSFDNPGEITVKFSWFLDQFSHRIRSDSVQKFLKITQKNGRITSKREGRYITINCPKLKELADEYTAKMLSQMSGVNRDLIGNESVPKKKEVRIKKKERKEKEKTEEEASSTKINFSYEKKIWENITDEDKELWAKAYPACNIRAELLKMAVWLLADKTRKKIQYKRFITGWLSRSQDSGGTKGIEKKSRHERMFGDKNENVIR